MTVILKSNFKIYLLHKLRSYLCSWLKNLSSSKYYCELISAPEILLLNPCHLVLTIILMCTRCMIRIGMPICVDVKRPVVNFLIRYLNSQYMKDRKPLMNTKGADLFSWYIEEDKFSLRWIIAKFLFLIT